MIRDDQICGLEDADMKQAHSGLDYDFSSCDPASSLEVPHGLPHHDFITLASDAHQLWERIRSSLSQQSPHSYDYVDWPQHHDNSQRQISCDGLLAGPGEFLSGASSTKTTVEGCLVDVDTRRNEDLSIISPVEATCTKLLGTQQYHYEDYAEEDGAFYRLEPATIHQSSTPTPICTCNSSGVGDAQANVQAVELGFAQDEITTPFPYKVCGRNHPVATSRTTVCQNHLRDPGSLPFPTLPDPSQSRRTRRRYEEIDRMYECGWNGCRRAYGTLNHLNTHIRKRSHGQKRLSEGTSTPNSA